MNAIQPDSVKPASKNSITERWNDRAVALLSHPQTKKVAGSVALLATAALGYALFQHYRYSGPCLSPKESWKIIQTAGPYMGDEQGRAGFYSDLRAAANCEPQGQNAMGKLYASGYMGGFKQGPESDAAHLRATEWFQQAAAQGNHDCAIRLSDHYRDGIGVQKDLSKACSILVNAADSGNAIIQYQLGMQHLNNQSACPTSDAKAFHYLSLAAKTPLLGVWTYACDRINNEDHDSSVMAAQLELGKLLSKGKGCEVNIREGLFWIEKAADQKHFKTVEAMRVQAKFYHDSSPLGQKSGLNLLKEADKYLRTEKGAIETTVDDIFSLAKTMLELKMEKEGMEWLSRSAERRHIPAMTLWSQLNPPEII